MHRILRITIATVFSIWGMILRVKRFTNRELWLDEINQIDFTLEPFKPLWLRDNPTKDITSFPGDYLLTYPFVKLFGASKLVAIPHAIVTMLGFYLLYLLCQRYFKTTFGYLISFVLFCFNGLLIWHALEIRPYAVLATSALACFYFAKDVIGKDDSNDRHILKKFLVGLLFITTILFHAFGLYIVFFVLVYHIINQLKEESLLDIMRRNMKFIGTIATIAILPWIWFAAGILLRSSEGFDVFEYVPNPFTDFYSFSGAIAGHLVAFRSLYFLLFGIFAAFIIPHQERFPQFNFFLTLIAFPILFILISAIIKDYWFIPRQYIWVIPLFCFFIGWCWDSVIQSFSEKSLVQIRSDIFS
jgi:hypothetical protein